MERRTTRPLRWVLGLRLCNRQGGSLALLLVMIRHQRKSIFSSCLSRSKGEIKSCNLWNKKFVTFSVELNDIGLTRNNEKNDGSRTFTLNPISVHDEVWANPEEPWALKNSAIGGTTINGTTDAMNLEAWRDQIWTTILLKGGQTVGEQKGHQFDGLSVKVWI
ncbi:unnamed protein product [Calypogeia fissa]